MMYSRGLAMHYLLCAHHFAPTRLADRLMSEANAEDGHASGGWLDQRQADTRFVGRARPGGDDDVRGFEFLNLIQGQIVIPENLQFRAKLAQILHQVVGEGVVVVDHQDHGASSAEASSAALSSARALCCVSRHSASGSESATTPAAAWTCSTRSFSTAVRMAMATPMSPLKPR